MVPSILAPLKSAIVATCATIIVLKIFQFTTIDTQISFFDITPTTSVIPPIQTATISPFMLTTYTEIRLTF